MARATSNVCNTCRRLQAPTGVQAISVHMACGPGHPEISKSYMDMASKSFTFTFTFKSAPRSTRLHKQIAQDSKGKPTCTQTSGTQPPGSCTLTTCHPLVRDRDNSSPLRLFLKVSGLIPRGPLGSKHELHVTTTLGTGGGPVSCVQLSEGGFQVVYHLGLLSGFSGVVTLAVRFGYGIHPLPQSSSPSQEHSRSAWPATSEA